MNKSDLRTGMMVVARNGAKYVVMVGVSFIYCNKMDILVAETEDNWLRLDSFSEGLAYTYYDTKLSELDIVAVYKPKLGASLWKKDIEDENYWECLWKREEPPVEMTVAEIEKKLGIKNLKIIKEHNDE